jgi:hypothetical protein
MRGTNKTEPKIRQKIRRETQLFFLYTLFFSLCFFAFTSFRRLVLGEYGINYAHYGFSVIEALILAKVILIGQSLGLGKRFEGKPLIFSTLYKTVIFSFFVLILSVLEHVIFGLFSGRDMAQVYQEIITMGIREILARTLIMFFTFGVFFAFIETSEVLGEHKLFNLFFKRNIK